MRLLIAGTLNGQLSTATKIAMSKGAKVTHTDTIDQALETLRAGRGADLVMVDVKLDIENLIARLAEEHICVPVVACGIENDARAAVSAMAVHHHPLVRATAPRVPAATADLRSTAHPAKSSMPVVAAFDSSSRHI